MSSTPRYSFSQLYLWSASRAQLFAVITKGIDIASAFFILAVLSVHDYGLYQLILAAVSITGSLTAGLFDDVISNELARALAERRIGWAKRLFGEFFTTRLTMSIAMAVLLFLGAGLVAQYYDKDIASYIRIMSVMVVFNALNVVQVFFFRAKVSFAAFGAGVLQVALRLVFLVAFWTAATLSLREILISTVLATAATALYTGFFFVREYRALFRGVAASSGWVISGLVRRFGRWIFLRYGVSRVFKGVDMWLIRIFINTEAVAIYAFTINLITFAHSLIPTGMLGTLLPWEAGEWQRFGYIYRRMVKYGFWFGLALAGGAAVFVPFAVEIFFPKYLPAMRIFYPMLATIPLYAVYKFQKTFLVVLREQKMLTMRLVTEGLITLAVLVLLLPVIGLYAAALMYLISYGGRVALYTVFLGRKYPELRLKPRHIVSFDAEDWILVGRAIRELVHPERWLKPIKSRV